MSGVPLDGSRPVADDRQWAAFATVLAGELASLPTGAVLLLREPGVDEHFAQFLQLPDQLRAEVAGDLDEDGNPGLLTVRDQRLLSAVGWQAPAAGDHDPNWWQPLDWPATSAEYRRLVDAVVTALRDVQEIGSPEVLVYRSWESGGRRRAPRLPGVRPDPQWTPAG